MKQTWTARHFRGPEGRPLSKEGIGEAIKALVLRSETNEISDVVLGDSDSGVVICSTLNGPHSAANARIIAHIPQMMFAIELFRYYMEHATFDGEDESEEGHELTSYRMALVLQLTRLIDLQEGSSVIEPSDPPAEEVAGTDDAH